MRLLSVAGGMLAFTSAVLLIGCLLRTLQTRAAKEPRVDEETNGVFGDSQFAAIFHAAPVAMMIVRLEDGRIIVVNHAACELWGYTRDEFEGRTSMQLQLWIEPTQFIQTLTLNRNRDSHELAIREKSGARRDASISVTMLQLEGGAHLLITVTDVTHQKRAQAMEHIAHHDTLTNLPNRLLLHSKLQELVRRIDAVGVVWAQCYSST